MEEAIAKVKEIDNNDELYLKMLSEPPLTDPDYREKTYKELENWLCNIIDTGYEAARRRPVHGKIAVYDDVYTKRVRRDEKLRNNKITFAIGRILVTLNKLRRR
jgi:hypothetical protein